MYISNQTGQDVAGPGNAAGDSTLQDAWVWASDVMWIMADDRSIAVSLSRVGHDLRLSAEGRDLDVSGYFNDDDSAGAPLELGKKAIHPGSPTRFGQPLLFGDASRANLLIGARSADFIVGGAFKDVMFGREGDDAMFGEAGDDFLYGQLGDDHLTGGAGHDRLFGGGGDDTVIGDDGHDQLSGGLGDDRIEGGFGDDILAGNEGDDVLAGEQGNDIYQFGRGDGNDTIYNFNAQWPDGYLDGDQDRVEFDTGISPEQIWFARSGDDLKVSLLGGRDSMLVKQWYEDSRYRIDGFYLDGGRRLMQDQVELLVQAMAALTPPAASESALPAPQLDVLAPVLAVAWQTGTVA